MANVTFALDQSGLAFRAGQWVLAQSRSTPAAQIFGQIVSYAGAALAVDPISTGGSGTYNDWTIVLAGSAAAAGYQPPLGSGNVTGPGAAGPGNLAIFADAAGKVISDSGFPAGTLAGRNTLLFGDAGVMTIPRSALSPSVFSTPLMAVQAAENFLLANDGANATRDIGIGAGRCEDDTTAVRLRLSGTMVKRLDTAWAAGGLSGAPAGGCDTGTKAASQTWHIYVIGSAALTPISASRSSSVATVTITAHGLGLGATFQLEGFGSGFDAAGVITAVTANTVSYANTGANTGTVTAPATATAMGFDVLVSQSYPAPAMPAGWTTKQCLGSILTDGSANIRAFTQVGDNFLLTAPVLNANLFLGDTNAHLLGLTVPVGLKVEAKYSASGSGMYFSSPDQTDEAVSGGLGAGAGEFRTRTNTSGVVRYRVASLGGSLSVNTTGWRDPRRRLF